MTTQEPGLYDFDEIIDRRSSESAKWTLFAEDVLPMWVADMDFRSPPEVIEAVKARADHGVFGYAFDLPELRTAISERMARLYDWHITPDDVLFLPGLVPAINMVCRGFAQPDDKVLIQPPIYPPFIDAPVRFEQSTIDAPMRMVRDGQRLYYEIDFEAFEAAAADPHTRIFMMANPHNPTGRIFTREELTRMAEICLKHDVLIASDEIHCDLLLDDRPHIPTASLSPEVAAKTITLMAPSKTFNIAGLGCAWAIVQDADLRKRLRETTFMVLPLVNIMGFYAALAALEHGQPWLDALLDYLRENRDLMVRYVEEHLPELAITCPEATVLAWLDCRALPVENPYKFLLTEGKVALNDGKSFGASGEGFVRLNFGCPRATLIEGLERIRAAVESLR